MNQPSKRKSRLFMLICGAVFFLMCSLPTAAQLSVYTAQNLSFGAFSHGSSGGTIGVSPAGGRTVSGDVIALNLGSQYFPAIFEVTAPEGTIINIVKGPDAQLAGSNGGSMTLHVGTTDPVFPFISTISAPGINSIKVGATLNVGGPSANPPGHYSGSFKITFIQE